LDWQIPFEPIIAGRQVNVHLVLEYLAFFLAFRYYLYLRRKEEDHITGQHRLSIILGAIFGAFFGSRLMGYLEYPTAVTSVEQAVQLLNSKSIMGGLFGGLLAVEATKWLIGEKRRSGDLFTLPIIVGIMIGRVGCFLSGINEFTYGKASTLIFAMDLGDGIPRHPIALYEILFLFVLFWILRPIFKNKVLSEGKVFQLFMILYFGFRFLIEFIKPNTFFLGGLSSIQWLCVVCWLYYHRSIHQFIQDAGKRLHLL